MAKISVLLSDDEESRFCSYCEEKGYKKSTLIARLIREHLKSEGYTTQADLFGDAGKTPSGRAGSSGTRKAK